MASLPAYCPYCGAGSVETITLEQISSPWTLQLPKIGTMSFGKPRVYAVQGIPQKNCHACGTKYEVIEPGCFAEGILYPEETVAQMKIAGITLTDLVTELQYITRPTQSLQDSIKQEITQRNPPLHLWLLHNGKRYFLKVYRIKTDACKNFKAGDLVEVRL